MEETQAGDSGGAGRRGNGMTAGAGAFPVISCGLHERDTLYVIAPLIEMICPEM